AARPATDSRSRLLRTCLLAVGWETCFAFLGRSSATHAHSTRFPRAGSEGGARLVPACPSGRAPGTPASSLERRRADRPARRQAEIMDVGVYSHPPPPTRRSLARRVAIRGGAAESKALTIRLAKQGLKCHCNLGYNREALGWLDLKTVRKPARSV